MSLLLLLQNSATAFTRRFDFTTGLGTGLTLTRASVGTAENAAGTTSTDFASGVARRTDRGLLIEPAATNLLWPSTPDTASTLWAVQSTSTITVNVAVAPDGATTASNLSFPAGSATDSAIFRSASTTAGTFTTAAWVKGTAGQQIYFHFDPSVAPFYRKLHTFSGSWERITLDPFTKDAAERYIYWDTKDRLHGNRHLAAITFAVWHCDVHEEAKQTSAIKTTTATATRLADAATFTPTSGTTQLYFHFDDQTTQREVATGGTPYNIPTTFRRTYIPSVYEDVASGAYTITIQASAVPIGGGTVNPVFARSTTIEASSVPITGGTVNPVYNQSITIAASGVPIAGGTINPLVAFNESITPSSVPITGANLATAYGQAITVAASAVPIAGGTLDPVYGRSITVSAAAVPITGGTVNPAYGRSTTVEASSVPIAGGTVNPVYGQAVTVTPSAVPITGGTVSPVFNTTVSITPSAVPISGASITPVHSGGSVNYSTTIEAGAVPIAGATINPALALRTTIEAGAIPISGGTVAPVYNKTLAVEPSAVPVSGSNVVPVYGRVAAITQADVALTGANVVPVYGRSEAIEPSSVPIAGGNITPIWSGGGINYTISVTPGDIPVTGQNLVLDFVAGPGAAIPVVTGGGGGYVGARAGRDRFTTRTRYPTLFVDARQTLLPLLQAADIELSWEDDDEEAITAFMMLMEAGEIPSFTN